MIKTVLLGALVCAAGSAWAADAPSPDAAQKLKQSAEQKEQKAKVHEHKGHAPKDQSPEKAEARKKQATERRAKLALIDDACKKDPKGDACKAAKTAYADWKKVNK